MKKLKLILASLALVAMAACASTGTTSVAETPSVSNCLKIDANTSLISATNGVNLPGISIPAMASQTLLEGDGECNVRRTPDGNLVGVGQQFTQNADIREKMIAGGFGIAQAATTGVFSAAIMADAQKCNGGNCGGPSFYVQGAQAYSGSEANSDASAVLTTGSKCGENPCGGSPD